MEPRRASVDGAADAEIPFAQALRSLFAVPSVRAVFFASGLHSVGMYAVLGWSVPYLMRVHGVSNGEAGVRLAFASGLLTAVGTLAGGALADRLARRDRRWLLWQPALALIAAFPFAVGFVLAPSAGTAMWLLAPVSVLTGSCFGPFYSVVQTVVEPRMRALAAALVVSCNTLLGLGLAPPIVGWLNEVWAPRFGVESIRYSLLAVLTAHLGSALCLWIASRSVLRDLGSGEAGRG